jgi:hypothetical protein
MGGNPIYRTMLWAKDEFGYETGRSTKKWMKRDHELCPRIRM